MNVFQFATLMLISIFLLPHNNRFHELRRLLKYNNAEAPNSQNEKPLVIGILTLPLSHTLQTKVEKELHSRVEEKLKDYPDDINNEMSFFPLSYAKWLISYNVIIIPIDIKNEPEYILKAMDHLNALLLIGGVTPIYIHNQKITIDGENSHAILKREPSDYTKTVKQIIEKAKEINISRRFGIWGTCLGFESLLIADSDYTLGLNFVGNLDYNSSIHIEDPNKDEGKFLSSELRLNSSKHKDLFYFNHNWAFTVDNFKSNEKIKDNWEIIATSNTRSNHRIIAMVKAKGYPFYAVQFHPEKTEFETGPKVHAVRTKEAITAAQKLAQLFLKSIEKSKNDKDINIDKLLSLVNHDEIGYKISNAGVFSEIIVMKNKNNDTSMEKF